MLCAKHPNIHVTVIDHVSCVRSGPVPRAGVKRVVIDVRVSGVFLNMLQWRDMSPQLWREYVNQEVCVVTHDQQRLEGCVFTVDPVSASVVLVSLREHETASVRLILGHAVTDVQILRRASEETERKMKSVFLPDGTRVLSAEELKSRRESLRLWLEKNRIPVTEDGENLRVANVLTVNPPYGTGDCSCANEIILARVQSLMESAPDARH